MSLLDSACRIGHRKYLLNELIMRLRKHTTLFRLKFFRRRSGRNGFANSSILGHLGSFRSLRDPRSHRASRVSLGFVDRPISRMFRFFQGERLSRSLEIHRISGSLDPRLPGRTRSRILDVLEFRHPGIPRIVLILKYLDPCTQIVE